MSEIVNLKRARKAKARHAKDVVAEANRAKHGVSKSKHNLAKVRIAKAKRDVDALKLDEES